MPTPGAATWPWAIPSRKASGTRSPASPGGHRGWADRVAEELSRGHADFAYANLAVRGRLLQQIVDQQLAPCLALKPDLVTLSAGGNDLIRPGGDPDALAEKLDSVVQILSLGGATVVLFNGPDTGSSVLGRIRSKMAIYNENLRTVAARHDAVIADMWSLRQLSDPQMWDQDRLHFSPLGHHTIAAMVLDSLNVQHTLEPLLPQAPAPAHLARGALRGPGVGTRILRSVGCPPAAPPVLRRRHHRQAAHAGSGFRSRHAAGFRRGPRTRARAEVAAARVDADDVVRLQAETAAAARAPRDTPGSRPEEPPGRAVPGIPLCPLVPGAAHGRSVRCRRRTGGGRRPDPQDAHPAAHLALCAPRRPPLAAGAVRAAAASGKPGHVPADGHRRRGGGPERPGPGRVPWPAAPTRPGRSSRRNCSAAVLRARAWSWRT